MNSDVFELVETDNFLVKRHCVCRSTDTREVGVSYDSVEFFCEKCSGSTEGEFDSINEFLDASEQVFQEPAFFTDVFVGMQLGDFQILERIGSGGMARVYLAIDGQLKRHVAVKIIQNRNYVTLESQAKLLKAEAISQASLHHPNVVAIYHVGSHEGMPFLAMEYVDGGSLAEKVKEGNLQFEEILAYTRQIISGLAEAYRIGLVHGDIKPANLLVDDNGNVKLSDFGLARQVSDENAVPKMLVGTPAYMAPELFEMEPSNEKSDLFSLGVTLFQLSFGKVPYVLEGQSIEELKVCFESAEIEFPDTWPEGYPLWWKEILNRLLDKNVERRYRNVFELEQDLEEKNANSIEAKTVPKLSSFLLDNLFFGFLCLPLLGLVTGVAGGLGVAGTALIVVTALAGPLCLITLTSRAGRTAGQLISNTRFNQPSCPRPDPRTMVKYQMLQLLPMICVLGGALVVSLLGAPVALTLMSCGIAIAICHIMDVILHGKHSNFFERTCQLQTVVDI